MLLEFSVNNFKSIKDTAIFSLNVKNQNEKSIPIRNYHLLNSAVLYGANATGKSNLLKAITFMADLVLNKDKVTQSTDYLKHIPYKLSTETSDASSLFEAVFFIDEVKYRYGFELDAQKVYSEWLFEDKKGKEAKLFYRDTEENEFYINKVKFKEGLNLRVLDNHLFIWKVDQEGGKIGNTILQWFNKLNLMDNSDPAPLSIINLLENNEFKQKIMNFLENADIGIKDISLEEVIIDVEDIEKLPIPDFIKNKMLKHPEDVSANKIRTVHEQFDSSLKKVKPISFNLSEESAGTQQLLSVLGPILDTLLTGKILLIDEFGASLHPMLAKQLIKLFNDKTINKNKAQFIIATHDTNLLDNQLFVKEQIWFTEKDNYGATEITPLTSYKNIRANEDFEKNYLKGKYGGIPFLGELHF